jgi:cation diffusion facilitator family transporter
MIPTRQSQVKKVLLITLALNLVVMALKAIVGVQIGSLSLQADALHSVTDSANNVVGLVANRLSDPTPDRDHPYGHQKFEGVAALGIAAFLLLACFEILQGAVTRLLQGGKPIEVAGPELWVILLVLGINIFVAYYERWMGQKLNSPILIADAYHTMSDIWITITVLVGLVGIWWGNIEKIPQLQWLDTILAFPVALMVLRSGWMVLKENVPWLVDEMAIPPETISQIVMQVPGVINCHDIASRGVVGRQVFIEMHLTVDVQDVESAHRITETIEAHLDEKFRPVRVLIHVEPPDYQSETLFPKH